MPMDKNTSITIAGAGLVGSLLAIYLARRGYQVRLFERRKDPRIARALGVVGEGRSINLAISERGLSALEHVGLKAAILEQAVPMRGRLMHAQDSSTTFQAYGADDTQAINSISRGWLNCFLLDEAEKFDNVEMHFEHRVNSVDMVKKCLTITDTAHQKERQVFYDYLIGTDGSASAVRETLTRKNVTSETESELSHGYKEFVMDADGPGRFKMEKNALHIWPRGPFMMIALPNEDGSYTCTLFLSHKSTESSYYSFAALDDDKKISDFFTSQFPDFCKLVPNFLAQYHEHPTGRMVTVKSAPWGQKAVQLMGDAAHAIVPFFGQGMNAGFEDVHVFDTLLDKHSDWNALFEEFYQARKVNTDAIADMAVENFVEMSAKTADEKFLYQKKVEKLLHEKFPDEYVSRYSLVSFSQAPYSVARQVGEKQEIILKSLSDKYFPSLDIDWQYAHKLVETHLGEIKNKFSTFL
ncbi:MAG: FAD-dependent monooxygenase [Bdellovibrionaceae bacterium]|nr:FAD-dependent monooxygenase [Pseudobdellovibrionaceae bacterium]